MDIRAAFFNHMDEIEKYFSDHLKRATTHLDYVSYRPPRMALWIVYVYGIGRAIMKSYPKTL